MIQKPQESNLILPCSGEDKNALVGHAFKRGLKLVEWALPWLRTAAKLEDQEPPNARFLFCEGLGPEESFNAPGGSWECFVMHTRSPRMLVEFKEQADGSIVSGRIWDLEPTRREHFDGMARLMREMGEFAAEEMRGGE